MTERTPGVRAAQMRASIIANYPRPAHDANDDGLTFFLAALLGVALVGGCIAIIVGVVWGLGLHV